MARSWKVLEIDPKCKSHCWAQACRKLNGQYLDTFRFLQEEGMTLSLMWENYKFLIRAQRRRDNSGGWYGPYTAKERLDLFRQMMGLRITYYFSHDPMRLPPDIPGDEPIGYQFEDLTEEELHSSY